MKLNSNATYSRANSVLLENGVEILKFTQEFPVNIEKLGAKAIEYHEKYITANPALVEWTIEEDEQLEYFQDEIQDDKIGRKRNITHVDPMIDPAEGDVSEAPKSKFEEAIASVAEEEKPSADLSRKEQVRWYIQKGVTSPSKIAEKLNTNASYVQRLKKEIEIENRID